MAGRVAAGAGASELPEAFVGPADALVVCADGAFAGDAASTGFAFIASKYQTPPAAAKNRPGNRKRQKKKLRR